VILSINYTKFSKFMLFHIYNCLEKIRVASNVTFYPCSKKIHVGMSHYFFLWNKGLIHTQCQKDTSTRITFHFMFWKSENPLKSYNFLSFKKFNYLCASLWDFLRTRIKSDIWSYLYIFFPSNCQEMQEIWLLSKPEWYMCSPVYVGDEISWSEIIGTVHPKVNYKTRTRWNDFLFLITDDRDFRPQTCTNGLVF
jgi:hypothetical protein